MVYISFIFGYDFFFVSRALVQVVSGLVLFSFHIGPTPTLIPLSSKVPYLKMYLPGHFFW